jgi:hypothetical protein
MEVDVMEDTVKVKMTKDEMIVQLMELLKQSNMQKEANNTFEMCVYVDSLEKKLDAMTEELSNMQQQIKEMQEDTLVNNLKAQIQQSAEKLQNCCSLMKEELFVVKDNIRTKAKEIVSDVKKKGKAALNRVSELLGIKEKLVSMREYVQESRKEVSHTIEKIDAFGAGMREANQKIANTFRTFADKPTVDYSQREQKFSKTEIVKKPWMVQKKLLEAVEVRLDGAIDNVENLSRAVEINKMLDTYDKAMEKAHSEQEQTAPLALVAEPDHQYGADIFDAYMKEQKEEPGRTEAAVKPEKEKSKAR